MKFISLKTLIIYFKPERSIFIEFLDNFAFNFGSEVSLYFGSFNKYVNILYLDISEGSPFHYWFQDLRFNLVIPATKDHN